MIASNHEDGREKKKFTTIVDEVLKDFFPGWSKGRCKLSDDEDAKGYYDEALSEGNLSPIKNPYVTFYGGDLEFLIEETGVIEEIDRQLEEFKTDVDSDDRDLIYTKISNKLRKLVVDNDIVKKVSKVSEDDSDTWYEEGSTGEFDYLILSPGGGSPSYLIFEG